MDLFRAGRPRDLDHFEFFSTYHRSLYRYVEPVSVQPFSPRAVDRVLGPAMVALLRQSQHIGDVEVSEAWRYDGAGPTHWNDIDYTNQELLILAISEIVLAHNSNQAPERRMPENTLRHRIENSISNWRRLANKYAGDGELVYHENTLTSLPTKNVVLGSDGHALRDLDQVFENSPNSMRDIEAQLNFRGRYDYLRRR